MDRLQGVGPPGRPLVRHPRRDDGRGPGRRRGPDCWPASARTVGPDTPVSTSMDLHGNVSRELVHATDLITCYRMAPHEDAMDTKRARRPQPRENCWQVERPARSRPGSRSPSLLAGEQTSTRIEPAKSVYAAVEDVEATEGVIDAAIWVG
ncbi:M81 family metallopeptidase [Streptomyces sp. L7]